jgi:hypothetical protein
VTRCHASAAADSSATVQAKAMLAVSGAVTELSTPMPVAGTALPTKHAM